MKYYDGFVQHCKLTRGCKDALDGKAVFQVLQMVIVACCGLLFFLFGLLSDAVGCIRTYNECDIHKIKYS